MEHSDSVHVPVTQTEQTPSLQGNSGNLVPSRSAGFTPIPHELIPGRDFSSEMATHVGRHIQGTSI